MGRTPADSAGSPPGGAMAGRDEQLVRTLYSEHATALWSFVVPLVGGDRVRAQDVVQETMLRAWRRPEVLAQAHGSVRPWLFTVARNIVVDEGRRHRAHPDRPPGARPRTAGGGPPHPGPGRR